MDKNILIRIEHLTKHFPITRGIIFTRQIGSIKAVDDVSFTIRKGETLGLVGESGCGKTTLGRTILQLYRPTSGKVLYNGVDLTELDNAGMRRYRRQMQIVFQDPFASLNPRMSVGNILAAPLEVHHIDNREARSNMVQELLSLVGLSPYFTNRYPHEFSGGQRQRIGIARAISLKPEFIVLDEPISALDVSIQAQIVNLLDELQDTLGLTYLFIAHDLSMVRHISDRTAVMYLGKVVELASGDDLYSNPLHPYTKALISAVPVPNPKKERKRERIILEGDIPSPSSPPKGCHFHTRCPYAISRCKKDEPIWRQVDADHWVSCFLYE